MNETKELSFGEERVRVSFNPDNLDIVSQIKQKSAELINLVNSQATEGRSEKGRLTSLSVTAYEQAAMWAVKAVTSPVETVTPQVQQEG